MEVRRVIIHIRPVSLICDDQIAVGIDAKERNVATRGWLDTSAVDYIDLAKEMEQSGVKVIIFTDISRDGTLSGPAVARLHELAQAVSCRIVASGGVSGLDDLRALQEIGLYGAICGKALYAGRLTVKQAIQVGGDQHAGETNHSLS